MPSGAWVRVAGAVGLALAYLAFTSVGQRLWRVRIDAGARRLAEALVHGPFHPAVDWCAVLGSPLGSGLLALMLALVLGLRRGWLAAVLVLAALTAVTALEASQRLSPPSGVPWHELPGLLIRPRGRHLMVSTYPSGHTARVACLLLTAALLLPRRFAPVSVSLAVLLSLTVALQRVHAAAHSGCDVVGGLLLGGAAALAVVAAVALLERPTASGGAAGRVRGRAGAPPTGRHRSR